MKTVRLYNEEMLNWVESNCSDFTVLEYIVSPVTFDKVPYIIQFCTEQDELMFALKWSQ